MAIERTVAIVKPDGVRMGAAEDIIRLYSVQFAVIQRKNLHLTEEQVEKFYAEHREKFFFHGLVLAMTSGPIVALELEGEDVLSTVRVVNGDTNPAKAERGTIRAQWRSAGGPFNTVHGSDSHEAYMREREILFGT